MKNTKSPFDRSLDYCRTKTVYPTEGLGKGMKDIVGLIFNQMQFSDIKAFPSCKAFISPPFLWSTFLSTALFLPLCTALQRSLQNKGVFIRGKLLKVMKGKSGILLFLLFSLLCFWNRIPFIIIILFLDLGLLS